MKMLYIIAWVGLTLSIIVHIVSLMGPQDILSEIDAFVWMLHGSAVLLGFPAILCSQKLVCEAEEKDFWKAVLKNCPFWTRRMIGVFFLYGIINFILFISKDQVVTNHGTPASIFIGFSGHWMFFYSIEAAIFYSCLKAKICNILKKHDDTTSKTNGHAAGRTR